MKITGIILCLLMLFYGTPEAQVTDVCYGCDQPIGVGGMQSNYAFNTLNPTQIRYGLNVDTWTTFGEIKKRCGISTLGSNNVSLYGAWGNNNVELNVSVAIGIKAHASYGLGQFVYTDSFGLSLQSHTASEELFPYKDVAHDFTDVGDITIHADGKSIPVIFTQKQTYKVNNSFPDSTGWEPHFVSMGLEAPGQLRAQVTSTSGNLKGKYVYAYRFFKITSGLEGCHSVTHDSVGYRSVASATVYPKSQKVAVTLFDNYPVNAWWYFEGQHYSWCYPNNTKVLLERKKLDGKNEWFIIDTLTYSIDSQLVYIDNVSDTISATVQHTTEYSDAIIPIPGQLWRLTNGDGFLTDTSDTGSWRLAYSYYDPILRIESPLGQTVAVSGSGNSIIAQVTKGWSDSNRPKWIRLYQTIHSFLLAGGGDTTVFYGIGQFRANDLMLGDILPGSTCHDSLVIGDATYNDTLVILTWADSQVVNGIDSADITLVIDTIGQFFPYNELRNGFGDPVTIPPHKYDNQIPFSDIEYYDGRLWGIGNPACPSCIFYSSRNTYLESMFNWSPYNYWDINEGILGEVIALERAEGLGGEALYAFKENGIYFITGGATNLRIRIIKRGVGAISKKAITKHRETVYFMSPDLRIYSLRGNEVNEISQPIENWIDSIFYNEMVAPTYCVAFELGDAVKWFNTGAISNPPTVGKGGYGLSYHTNTGHWSIQQYGRTGAYVPVGSFLYDTTENKEDYVELVYSDTAIPLRYENNRAYSDAGNETNWAVWLPYYGDYKNNLQIQKFQATLGDRSGYSNLRYGVWDQDGDSLCADALVLFGQGDNLSIDLPYNEEKFLQLRFWMIAGEQYTSGQELLYRPQRISLYNVIESVRNMGGLGVQ